MPKVAREDKEHSPQGLGVSLEIRSSGNNYKARISHLGLQLNLGRFPDPHLARLAFDQAAVQLRGPDAATNYPIGSFPLNSPRVHKKVAQFLRSPSQANPAHHGSDSPTDTSSGKTSSDDPAHNEQAAAAPATAAVEELQLEDAAVLAAAAAIARSPSAEGLAAWLGEQAASTQPAAPEDETPGAMASLDYQLPSAAGIEGTGEAADDISHLLSWAHLQDFEQDDQELQNILAAGLAPAGIGGVDWQQQQQHPQQPQPQPQQTHAVAPHQVFTQDVSPFSVAVSLAEAAVAGNEVMQLQLPQPQQPRVWQGPPVPLTLPRQITLLLSSSSGGSDSGPSTYSGSQHQLQEQQQQQAAVTSNMRSLSGGFQQLGQPHVLSPAPAPQAAPQAACTLPPAGSHGSTYVSYALPSAPPIPAALLPPVGSTGSASTSTAVMLPSAGSTGSTHTSAVPALSSGGGSAWYAQAPPAAAADATAAGGFPQQSSVAWAPGGSHAAVVLPGIYNAMQLISDCSRAALHLRSHLLANNVGNPDALGDISDWYFSFRQSAAGAAAPVRRVLARVAEALAHAPMRPGPAAGLSGTGSGSGSSLLGGMAARQQQAGAGSAVPEGAIARSDALQLLAAQARAFESLYQQLLMVAQSEQAPATTAAAAAAMVQQWLGMLTHPAGSDSAGLNGSHWLQAAVVMVAYQMATEVKTAVQNLQ